MQVPFERSWWIEPGKILGGRYPGLEEELSEEMLTSLLSMGIRVMLNLQEPHELGRNVKPFADYQPLMTSLAQQRGTQVAFHRVPMPDMGIPSTQRMQEIQGILKACMAESKTLYVHCWGGHGRTSTVAGCWHVSQGKSPEEALRLIRAARAHSQYLSDIRVPQSPSQEEFIANWSWLSNRTKEKK